MLHPMLLEAGLLRVPKILVLLFAFFFFLSCFLSLFFQCLYRTSIPWSSTICILLSATPLRLPHFTDSWGTRWTRNRAFSALNGLRLMSSRAWFLGCLLHWTGTGGVFWNLFFCCVGSFILRRGIVGGRSFPLPSALLCKVRLLFRKSSLLIYTVSVLWDSLRTGKNHGLAIPVYIQALVAGGLADSFE